MPSRKNLILKLASTLALLLASVAFVGSCIITMTDAQGGIVFIVTIPLLIVLLAVAIICAGRVEPRTRYSRVLHFKGWAFGAVVVVFFMGFWISPLGFVSNGIMGVINTSFVAIAGQSPYAWARSKTKH